MDAYRDPTTKPNTKKGKTAEQKREKKAAEEKMKQITEDALLAAQ
jgi:hypothetical protein